MDEFFARLIVRTATIDELLSDDFEPLLGQKADADLAAQRLAAWCRACASGDWSLFCRRLERDRLSIADVLARFATVRRSVAAPRPPYIDDAIWIMTALHSPVKGLQSFDRPDQHKPCAFETLFTPLVEQAVARLWSGIDARVAGNLNESAHADLRHAILKALSDLCAPALYQRFVQTRNNSTTRTQTGKPRTRRSLYDRFVAEMKAGGLRHLFEEKPVLLRLIASITRQWIDTSRELVLRLDADLETIRRDLLITDTYSRVTEIKGELSDLHNSGHSVQVVRFQDGLRVVYKPKDLGPDAAWYALTTRLNHAGPPVELKAARAIVRDAYGWAEFVDHVGCSDEQGFARFFERAGAWLALLHCFCGADMHQENMIASGEHPVPIDLEMILQGTFEEYKSHQAETEASEAAMDTVSNSVMSVGLLPAYGRAPDNKVFAIGGMTSAPKSITALTWKDINSDTMRPARTNEPQEVTSNLPHIENRYAKFGDYTDDFIRGFESYASFLMRHRGSDTEGGLLEGFAGLRLRRVVRSTRFYYLLLQRLRDHRNMNDGIIWSAQADFVARLSDWENESDLLWPLQQAERSAFVQLNVPHFVMPSDGYEIRDATGISIRTKSTPGLDRARGRLQSFDAQDVTWQVTVIKHAVSVSRSAAPIVKQKPKRSVRAAPTNHAFLAEADKIAEEIGSHSIRRGPGAAWIGLDWLGDSEVAQLVALGPDLYNGVAGIAVFLAAHAALTGRKSSQELALAAVTHLRNNLKSRNGARMARSLGVGGGTGLGSIVYALTLLAKFLHDDDILADAHAAAGLFSDDLIAADKQFDVIGGCAGGMLGLLRLNRDGGSRHVLERALKCGEHLLAQRRHGAEGSRSWIGQGLGERPLNGMSHGAAGFAYALASLAAATGREEFAEAASECITFEDSSYDAERTNWPDFRGDGEATWPCQWCHGAPGIGLARIAMTKRGEWISKVDFNRVSKLITADVGNALSGVERGWPGHADTLCCGTLGSIEFFCEASTALGRGELRERASRRLMTVLKTAASSGDYRWNFGNRQFNLGLFRGLAGAGYTCLRRIDASLPNVLIWE
jgi:type 2 lantibiotic biosynthesis protein LanM